MPESSRMVACVNAGRARPKSFAVRLSFRRHDWTCYSMLRERFSSGGVALGAAGCRDYHVTLRPVCSGPRMVGSRDGELQGSDGSTPDQQQDLKLIRAVARRDRHAFETLYYRHSPRLGRYLMRLLRQQELVEEALNDVMLVVWQSAERFDPAVARLSTWLLGIAHNKALKALALQRARSTEIPLDPLALDDCDSQEESDDPLNKADPHNPERMLMGRELGRLLDSALEKLSPEHRCVIELAFSEDCSYQEIAAITDCPVNTVKTRMFYARKRLADILRQQGVADSFGR
jgi:RNA polymerase sigma-70 factor (ECF subfamily)